MMMSSVSVLRTTRGLTRLCARLPVVSSVRLVSRLGPDRVLPANSLTTTWPDGSVIIRKYDHESSDYPPKSVYTMLQETLARVPDRTALAVKRDGVWVKWTYSEYIEDILTVAKAFIHLGLKKSHAVGILGFNNPEWHISNIAAVVAGGLATGIYTTNSPDAVRYVAEHSRANILVVENQEQLDKISTFREKLDHLETVIQFSGTPEPDSDVISWDELLEVGRSVDDSVLQERLQQQAVNQPCMLVYTSGTTGNPKGVMLSQDNLTWTCQRAHEVYDWKYDYEEVVSYLPLSHVAGTFIDIYLIMFGGGTVWFADKMAMQGTLLKTLVEARPTLFFGVPRVYEKVMEKMSDAAKLQSPLKQKISAAAKAAATEHHFATFEGKPGGGIKYKLAQKVVMSKVAKVLGFDRTRGFYSSAAPLSEDVFKYFCSLDMPIQELLGSSETTGPQTASTPGPGIRLGSVGKPYDVWDVHVLNPDQTGLGEIATRGRNACMGYIWDEKKTSELFNEAGYVLSGDLGRFDSNGFLFISGRQKEIIVTAGGENIAPVPIEDAIKELLKDYIANCLVIGDKRKHLAAILTLRSVLDEKNQPTNNLHPNVIKVELVLSNIPY